MPRRTYRKFRRTYKRKFKKSLATKVAKLTKAVKLIKPEVKTYENRNTSGTFTWAGDIGTPLTGIAQGYSDGTRVGDSLNLRNMRLHMYLKLSSGTNDPCLARVIVFQLKNNPDGIVTVGSTINLLLDSTNTSTVTAPLAPLDVNNANSYRVLYDKTHTLHVGVGAGTSASAGAYIKHLPLNIKFPYAGRKVEFSPGTGTITKNETYIMVISNTSTAASWVYNSMTYYTDA